MTRLASALFAVLLLGGGCYDEVFGDGVLDDDDALGEDLPTCEELSASTTPAFDDCHAVEAFETFEPNEQVEWQWSGSTVNSAFDQVIASPVVINLTDDDGDGDVDRNDVPDVVFYSMNDGQYSSGVTRAISGVDGGELWNQNTGALRSTPTPTSPPGTCWTSTSAPRS